MDMLFATALFAIVVTCAVQMFQRRPEPPQLIYVQAAPERSSSGIGCLPLVVLLLFILLVIAINPSF